MADIFEEPSSFSPRVVGNEILFFGEITEENTLDFLDKFKTLENELLKKYVDNPLCKPSIKVIINSGGGDLFAGIAAMNILQKARVKVITEVQGACCSAATFLLLGGSHRQMGKDAFILIHQISTGEFWGKFQELKNELKCCSTLMERVECIYRGQTKIPDKIFKRMMKRDIYVDSVKSLKYRIIHEIV